jgi:hypothetical protein
MSASVFSLVVWFLIGTLLFGRITLRHLPGDIEGLPRFIICILVGFLAASMLLRFVVWLTQ